MPKRYLSVEEKRQHARDHMMRVAAAMGPSSQFEMMPNNMAAGPCPACLTAAQTRFGVEEAPLMPLDECPHPEQCTGHYRFVIDLS